MHFHHAFDWKSAAIVAFFGVVTAVPSQCEADLITGDPFDLNIHQDGVLGNSGASQLEFGDITNGVPRNAIFMFDLSSVTGSIVSANLGVALVDLSGTQPPFNGDLYGVGYGSANNDFPSALDYNGGPTDTTNTADLLLIQPDFLTPATPQDQLIDTNPAGDAALVSYLNNRPMGEDFVFFRLSPDVDIVDMSGSGANIFYRIASANNGTIALRPLLTVEAAVVPEPASLTMMGVAALFGIGVTVRRRRRR